MSERLFVGLDPTSTGAWWSVDGELRFEPAPDAADQIETIRRQIQDAQRDAAFRTQRAAGRLP